jgi:hypothetical protein
MTGKMILLLPGGQVLDEHAISERLLANYNKYVNQCDDENCLTDTFAHQH